MGGSLMDLQIAAVIAANPKLEELFVRRFEAYTTFDKTKDQEWDAAVTGIVDMWESVGISGVASVTAYLQWREFYRVHGRITYGLTGSSSDCSEPCA